MREVLYFSLSLSFFLFLFFPLTRCFLNILSNSVAWLVNAILGSRVTIILPRFALIYFCTRPLAFRRTSALHSSGSAIYVTFALRRADTHLLVSLILHLVRPEKRNPIQYICFPAIPLHPNLYSGSCVSRQHLIRSHRRESEPLISGSCG